MCRCPLYKSAKHLEKITGNHMINKLGATVVYLEVGSRSPTEVTTCSDIDRMSKTPTAISCTPYHHAEVAPGGVGGVAV